MPSDPIHIFCAHCFRGFGSLSLFLLLLAGGGGGDGVYPYDFCFVFFFFGDADATQRNGFMDGVKSTQYLFQVIETEFIILYLLT